MRKYRRGKKCTYCGKRKSITKFHYNKTARDGHHAHCKACHSKNVRDIYLIGYQVWNKKRLLPRIKTLAKVKREVKTKKYMESAVDRMAGMIADAIIRRKYGISDADIRRLERSQKNVPGQ